MRTKILLAICNLILAGFLIAGWRNGDIKQLEKENKDNQQENCSIPMSSRISPETAQLLANAYKNSLEIVNTELKINDSRCVWFSLVEIEKFICAIKSGVNRDGCTKDLNKLGIRFYYGRYPGLSQMRSNDNFASIKDEYAGLHTVFLIPTYDKDKDKAHYDFDPGFSISPGDCDPLPLEKLTKKGTYMSKKSAYILSSIPLQNSTNWVERNHGQLIPPEDETGAFFLQSNEHLAQ